MASARELGVAARGETWSLGPITNAHHTAVIRPYRPSLDGVIRGVTVPSSCPSKGHTVRYGTRITATRKPVFTVTGAQPYVEVHSSETQRNKNSCPKPSLNTKQKQAQPHKPEITAMQTWNFHTTVTRSTHIQFGNNHDENAEFSHDTSRIKNRPSSN